MQAVIAAEAGPKVPPSSGECGATALVAAALAAEVRNPLSRLYAIRDPMTIVDDILLYQDIEEVLTRSTSVRTEVDRIRRIENIMYLLRDNLKLRVAWPDAMADLSKVFQTTIIKSVDEFWLIETITRLVAVGLRFDLIISQYILGTEILMVQCLPSKHKTTSIIVCRGKIWAIDDGMYKQFDSEEKWLRAAALCVS